MSVNPEALFQALIEEGFDAEFAEEDEEIKIPCPLCEDDEPRLNINAEMGMWICFRCGERGNLFKLFQDVCGLDGQDAFDKIREVKTDEVFLTPTKPKLETPFEGVELPPEFIPFTADAPPYMLKYIQKRGVPLELAQSHNFGYALDGLYAYRVILPVTSGGTLYTFVARSVFKRCPECLHFECECDYPFKKVLTPSGGRPTLTLYNLDFARAGGSGTIILCEGAFDCLRFPEQGVALLTSHISPAQVSLLAGLYSDYKNKHKTVIVCLDGDEAGREGTKQVASALVSAMVPVRVATLPDGTDPGSLNMTELTGFLDASRRYSL